MGNRRLVALLCLSSWCLVIVVAIPCGATGLSRVCDCGYPDHTQLLFLTQISTRIALGSYVEKKVMFYSTRLCLYFLSGFQ